MSKAEQDIRRKLRVFEYAERTGNIRKTWRRAGASGGGGSAMSGRDHSAARSGRYLLNGQFAKASEQPSPAWGRCWQDPSETLRERLR